MDGVRAYWNGQRLLSRQGNEISAPEEFTRKLPHGQMLDGELWMGRGTFDALMSILKSKHDWNAVEYCVFDIPLSKEPYEKRLAQLQRLQLPPQVQSILKWPRLTSSSRF